MKEKKKNKEIITIGLVLLLVVMIVGVSYAAFTFSKTGVTENAITTSAVTMIYTEGDNQITINNAIPITEEVGKTLSDENYVFDFTIDIKTGPKMPISYEITAVKDASSTMRNEDVRLYLQKSLDGTNYDNEVLEPSPYTPLDADDEFGAKAGEMVMDVGNVSEKVTYYYRLRMWVDSSYELSSEAKIFTVKVNAYGKTGTYPEPIKKQNIKVAYTYNEESGSLSYCITGEEATCKETNCYEDESVDSCKVGTVIKYAVNDQEEKYFHVIHDDGKTMTLQQIESTTEFVEWCSKEDYIAAGGTEEEWSSRGANKGPLTALKALEDATVGWTNVNNQTYTMGTTIFKDNAYTFCDGDLSCTTNTYILSPRKAKARMLTVQEAVALGCTKTTCPELIYTSNDFWLMSTKSDSAVWYRLIEYLTYMNVYNRATVRAVIVINK